MISQDDLRHLERKTSELLRRLGEPLSQAWQHSQQVSLKAYREPVTEIDIKTEEAIRVELAKLLPEAGFIVEEGTTDRANDLNWVIDPIDQTKNFVSQTPLFYTQVALLRDTEPILGVIYNPLSDQLFSASYGNGTKLNNKPIVSRPKGKLEESLVDIDFGGNNGDLDWKVAVFKSLADAAYRVRITGGAFAPYIITGGIDAYVVVNQHTKIVDQMPRIIIAREAGLTYESFETKGYIVSITGFHTVVSSIHHYLVG